MPIDITIYWNLIKEWLGRCVFTLDNPIQYQGNGLDFSLSCITIGFIIAVVVFVYFLTQYQGIKKKR